MTRTSSGQSRAERMIKTGDTAKDRGDLIGARKSYEAALHLVPDLPLAMCGLAAVEGREGNHSAAEALLKGVIAGSAPSATRAGSCVALASGLFNLGRWDEAYESYAKVLMIDIAETYPGERDWLRAEAYAGMGAIEAQRNNDVAAAELYSTAVRLAPNNAQVLADFGLYYARVGKPAAAVNALENALRLEPERGAWWFDLGDIYRDVGRQHQARPCYERAVKYGMEDAAEALAELPPDTAQQWYESGKEFELAADARGAAYCFRRALMLGDKRAEAELRRLEDEQRP